MGSLAEAASSRGRRVLSLLPAPLAALLALVAVLGVAWALLVPPWQSPDETWHYAYAQRLGERFLLAGDNPRRQSFSTDQSLADQAAGASNTAFYPLQTHPSWSASAARGYRATFAHEHPSQSDGGGDNSEASNPPLLYAFDDIPYLVDGGGDAFSRLYTMQLWNVTLLLATVVGAWLLAGEVFGRRRLAQLATAALAGLIPEQTFMLTSVNPDALLTASWTLAMWMGARVINRAARTRDIAVMSALVAVAILAKATGYALVPAGVLAVGLGWRRRPAPRLRRDARWLLAGLVPLAAPVLSWVGYAHAAGRPVVNQITTAGSGVHHAFNVKQLLSYVWQFYLPRLGFMTPLRTTQPDLAVYAIWLREGWGVFGYVDVALPSWVYTALGVFTALLLVAAVVLIARTVCARRGRSLTAFLTVTLGGLLVLLHVSDYRSVIHGRGPLVQGRYLLPIVGLLGLAAGLVVVRLPARLRAPAVGALIGGLVLVQLLAFSTVATTYYT